MNSNRFVVHLSRSRAASFSLCAISRRALAHGLPEYRTQVRTGWSTWL